MAYLLKHGAFTFPAGFHCESVGGGFDLAAQPRARGAGSATSDGRTTDRRLIVSGQWIADTVAAWHTQRDTILRAVGRGPGDLWFGRDDRYYRQAQLDSWGHSDPIARGRLWGVVGELSLTFVSARYPEEFSAGAAYSLQVLGPSDALALTTAYGPAGTQLGDAETLPLWTIEIGAAGTGPLQLNDSGGQQICLVYGPGTGGTFAAGAVITLNADGAKGTLNGSPTPGIYDRKIPRIRPPRGTDPGTTGFQIDSLGTATIARLAVDFPGRWV